MNHGISEPAEYRTYLKAVETLKEVDIGRQIIYILLQGPLHAMEIYAHVLGTANQVKNVRDALVVNGILSEKSYVTDKGQARKLYALIEGNQLEWNNGDLVIRT